MHLVKRKNPVRTTSQREKERKSEMRRKRSHDLCHILLSASLFILISTFIKLCFFLDDFLSDSPLFSWCCYQQFPYFPASRKSSKFENVFVMLSRNVEKRKSCEKFVLCRAKTQKANLLTGWWRREISRWLWFLRELIKIRKRRDDDSYEEVVTFIPANYSACH